MRPGEAGVRKPKADEQQDPLAAVLQTRIEGASNAKIQRRLDARLNDKYMDARSHVGEVFTVTNVATIGGQECVFTDPSLGGAYAADGFDLAPQDSEMTLEQRYEKLAEVAREMHDAIAPMHECCCEDTCVNLGEMGWGADCCFVTYHEKLKELGVVE